jgi:hypothetical protein
VNEQTSPKPTPQVFNAGQYDGNEEGMAWAIFGALVATGVISVDFVDHDWHREVELAIGVIAQSVHEHRSQ